MVDVKSMLIICKQETGGTLPIRRQEDTYNNMNIEERIDINKANSSNFVLFVLDRSLVLADKKKVIDFLNSMPRRGFRDESFKEEFAKTCILGQITLSPKQKNIFKVIDVSALRGYGALMYEIAMGEIYPNYLAPSSTIKETAKGIWKKFFEREDIEKIDQKQNQFFLDYIYRKDFNTKTLKNKGIILLNELEKKILTGDVKSFIKDSAEKHFWSLYGTTAESTIPSKTFSIFLEEVCDEFGHSNNSYRLEDPSDNSINLFELLFEKAVSPDEAFNQGIGLINHTDRSADSIRLTLVSMKDFLKKTKNKKHVELVDFKNSIIGTITAEHTMDELWRVSNVGAIKGYGPLLYDLVMDKIKKDWLCPSTDVRPMAQNVWKYYYENRKDIKHLPLSVLEENDYHQMQMLFPDSPWMWRIYKLKVPLQGIEKLYKNGEIVNKIMEDKFSYSGESKNDAAREFFRKRYDETKPKSNYK